MPNASPGRVVAPPGRPDPAEDRADLAALAFDVTNRAIGRLNEARFEAHEAYRLVGDRRDLEKWAGLASTVAIEAERRLIESILAWSPDYVGMKTSRPAKWRWPARGVRSNGVLYLAIPDPGGDGEEGGGEVDLMRLAVVEESAIVDLDDAPDLVDLGHEPAAAPAPAPSPLDGPHEARTVGEKVILAAARQMGESEAIHRLFLAGEYRRDRPEPEPARETDAPAGAQPQETPR